MEIGKSLTVRCGCYDKISLARKNLETLQKDYVLASVATTYKYRFDEPSKEGLSSLVKVKKEVKKTPKPKKPVRLFSTNVSDEELKLILQVYLYKSDLDNAYKVAKIGYKRNKKSYYWNQKMAEVSQWTGRGDESMKHMAFLYKKKHNNKLQTELINYGLFTRRYEDIEPYVYDKARRNPSKKNIDVMIYVHSQIGTPEKSAQFLERMYKKNKKKGEYLTEALEIYLEMGELESAKRVVSLIEKQNNYTTKNAELIAYYYYLEHDMSAAYNALTLAKGDDGSEKYYQLVSDLGWYTQDKKSSAAASRILMEKYQARLVDYERIVYVYQNDNNKLAAKAAKNAYVKNNVTYLFYSFAEESINSKKYDELNKLIKWIDSNKLSLHDEPLYWIIKSKVYAHYNKKDLEKEALLYALELNPNSNQVKLILLWNFMEQRDDRELKSLLVNLAEDDELDGGLYLPMASAYFYLNNIDRASFYTQELLLRDDPITQLTQFKFLQAYIYQVQNNEHGFVSYMKDIAKSLKKEAKNNKGLKKQDEHLSNYLRATMHISHPDKFEKRLKSAKKYLSKKNYDEIAYSWAIKNNAYEESLKIYHRIDKKELWMKFSNALVFQEHTNIENLLDVYLMNLSIGAASQAAEQDGQIALAQTITFEGLRLNSNDQGAYVKHLDLSKKRSDKLDVKASYYERSPLLQKYLKIKNRTYLQNSFDLYTAFDAYANSSQNYGELPLVPNATLKADVGLRKTYRRWYVEGHLEYHESMRGYFGTPLLGEYRFSTDLVGGVRLAINDDALESIQTQLAGRKDMIALNLSWTILNSTNVEFFHEQNVYESQDGVYLGYGDYSRVSVVQQIRNGYPDLRAGVFYDFGRYTESSASKGVMDRLLVPGVLALPDDFFNVGLSFSYGMANSESNEYTRVWRPYFEFYPYYNSVLKDYNYGFSAGFGGKVLHQDHLTVGATYGESLNGIGGRVFEVFLNYQFMYYHP